MKDYTSLSLTDPTDELPALSGIIAKLQVITGATCYAGLWEKHFARSLLWQVNHIAKRRQNQQHKTRLGSVVPSAWRCGDTPNVQRQYIAPSCSFASVDNPVDHTFWNMDPPSYNVEFCLKLQTCHLTSMDTKHPLGKLEA